MYYVRIGIGIYDASVKISKIEISIFVYYLTAYLRVKLAEKREKIAIKKLVRGYNGAFSPLKTP